MKDYRWVQRGLTYHYFAETSLPVGKVAPSSVTEGLWFIFIDGGPVGEVKGFLSAQLVVERMIKDGRERRPFE